jgi:DNA polymerase-4
MDAFYAAIEQLDDPSLRGRPLLIGPDSPRGVVLTASYEARPFGVGSAMPMQRARQLCPQALVIPPRFERYQQVSQLIMGVFGTFSPRVEALSLDEAFLDMTGCERLFGSPEVIGRRIKSAVFEATHGLTASVGISATRYVAKVASGFRKPDALTIVAPNEARDWLAALPVANLWGAGTKTATRLQALGLLTIGQVATADPRWLERELGAIGRRFYELANAIDDREVQVGRLARSVGSERTLTRDVSTRSDIEPHLRAAAEAVAQRLRRRSVRAGGVRIKLKRADFRLLTRQGLLPDATDVGATLLARALELLADIEDAGPFRLVGLAAFDLAEPDDARQLDLVPAGDSRRRRLEVTIDGLVDRFGVGIVQRAGDLLRDKGVGTPANLDFLDD